MDLNTVAFDIEDRGFRIRASYIPKSQNALIEVWRNGIPKPTANYPAYRIWNLAAHFSEMVDGELAKTPETAA